MKYLLLFALLFTFIATEDNLRGKEIEGYVEVPQGSSSMLIRSDEEKKKKKKKHERPQKKKDWLKEQEKKKQH